MTRFLSKIAIEFRERTGANPFFTTSKSYSLRATRLILEHLCSLNETRKPTITTFKNQSLIECLRGIQLRVLPAGESGQRDYTCRTICFII